jgi:NDP-sugar pyrophosphorylase family protein
MEKTMAAAPHTAVILAAGMGTRLGKITATRPKPLTPVHGTSILHNCLSQLSAAGVRHAVLVVGYLQDAIRAAVGDEFAGMTIEYIVSDVYATTGSAYSLWLARDVLTSGDVLLLEGDVYFEGAVLDQLLKHKGDVAAVDRFESFMSGSAAVVASNAVVEIRTGQNPASAGGLFKTINIYRVERTTSTDIIVPALDGEIAQGRVKGFLEQVLSGLIAQGALQLQAADCQGLRWMEIDDARDLAHAEEIFPAFQPILV